MFRPVLNVASHRPLFAWPYLQQDPNSVASQNPFPDNAFVRPLFSWSYELLFPQALYFDNHLRCPGMWRASKLLANSLLSVPSVVERFVSDTCGLFSRSLLPFETSPPLFSTAYGLFLQSTRGGGMPFTEHLNLMSFETLCPPGPHFMHTVLNSRLWDLEAAQP
jgi:hypothetical protein